MDISSALAKLETGQAVSRTAWLGKGITLCKVPALAFKAAAPCGVHATGDDLRLPAFIAMSVGNGVIVPWQPQQHDVVATDWLVLDVAQPEPKEAPDAPVGS